MRKTIITLACLQLFVLASRGQYSNYSSLKQMKWMAGNWKGMYNGAPFYEAWIYVNDSIMVNLSIEIKNNDTLVKEQGFIRARNGKIIHGGSNATWQLSKLNDTEMIFVNDTLKYASRIIWSHSKDDHWLTEIHNPGGKVINYDLVRVPWLDKAVNKFINRQ
jgi:hypothetical protein